MKLSVITINYKNYAGLSKTLQSIKQQVLFETVEVVVIDGGSCEKTVEMLKDFDQDLVKFVWLSERDAGIYDAMNKGLNLSTGNHVAYLNSGDCLFSKHTLQLLLDTLDTNHKASLLYGNIVFVDRNDRITRTWISGEFSRFKLLLGWMCPHPMTMFKRHYLLNMGGYDTNFNIASDYDLMLRILNDKTAVVHYLNHTTVKMETGGVSNGSLQNIIKSNIEVLASWRKAYGVIIPYWILFTKPLSKLCQLTSILK